MRAIDALIAERIGLAPVLQLAPFHTPLDTIAAALPDFDRELHVARLADGGMLVEVDREQRSISYALYPPVWDDAIARFRVLWGEPEALVDEHTASLVWLDREARVRLSASVQAATEEDPDEVRVVTLQPF